MRNNDMMRFKPIMLGAVLVVGLCGAAPPPDEAGAPAATPSSPEATAEPRAASTEPALDESLLQARETPAPAAADAPASGTTTEAAPPTDAPAEKAITPGKGQPPTREYFVGVWAEQGKSCETALDFKADGTLIGPFPRWELSDAGELTMVGNRQKIFLTVIDANTLQSRRAPTDLPRILKRCGG